MLILFKVMYSLSVSVLIKVCANAVHIVGGDILYRYYCEERHVRYLLLSFFHVRYLIKLMISDPTVTIFFDPNS